MVTRTDPLSYLAEDLEEELRTGLGEWDEAKLVDDEQFEPCQLLLEVEQPSLVPGLVQLVDQRGGGGEADRQPPLAGGEPQLRATWVLPVPLLPTAMTFSRRSTYSQRASWCGASIAYWPLQLLRLHAASLLSEWPTPYDASATLPCVHHSDSLIAVLRDAGLPTTRG